MKNKRKTLYLLLIAILSGFILLGIVVNSFWKSRYLINEPLHSSMEAFGAVTAIFTAIILLQKELEQDTGKYHLIATGLLSMGILDFFHAAATTGHKFVLLHNMANLIGSLWFAMVWLPATKRFTVKNKLIPWLAAASSALLGIIIIQFREIFHLMMQNGQFTNAAIAIDSIGAVLFMAAGIFFLLDFHRFTRLESYLFAGIFSLFSISNFEFASAAIWNNNWWLMHVQRLISYMLVAGFVVHKYQKTVSELATTLHWQKLAEDALQRSYQELETRVEERTLELSGTNRKLLMEVSDRKLAEEHTRKSERKYKNLVELSSDLIYMSDIDGNHIFMNNAGYHLLEAAPDQVIGRPWLQWIHPDDRERSLKIFTVMLQQGIDLFDFENRYLSKSGKVINALHNIRILKNENGDITGIQGIARDITRRKQAEASLFDSEERFHSLFNLASDCILLLDPSQKEGSVIVDANLSACSMHGYTREELIGKPITFLDNAECAKKVPEMGLRLRAGEAVSFEIDHIRKDKTVFPVEVSAKLVFIGGKPYILAIDRDITERKRIEEELNRHREHLEDLVGERTYELIKTNTNLQLEISERIRIENVLRESEARFKKLSTEFRTLLDAISDNLLLLSPELKILWANTSAAAMLDMDVADLTGRYCFELWFNRSSPCENCYAIRSFVTGRVEGTQVSFPDGRLFDSRSFPIREETGTITNVIVVRTDITEKTFLQAESMRTGQLASLGELAAGVAHEINNPINGIINYAQLLLDRMKAGNDEKDIIKRIIKEGDRIAKIVNSLLSFARDKRDNIDEKIPIKINDILTDCFDLTKAHIKKDGISLKIEIPKDLPEIIAYPQQIQQVFLNIISNARYALNKKYASKHTKKLLAIKAEKAMLNDRLHIRVTFHDNGTGIPSDILHKVINPFFSTKTSGEGTGLGLSISHGIINSHKGRLIIDSLVDEFTRITIELPAKM